MSQDQTIWQAGNVLVTNSRIIIKNKTYAVRNISSTSIVSSFNTALLLIIFVVIFGLCSMLFQNAGAAFVVGVIASIGILYFLGFSTYWIVLTENAGASKAYSTTKKNEAEQFLSAVVTAISNR